MLNIKFARRQIETMTHTKRIFVVSKCIWLHTCCLFGHRLRLHLGMCDTRGYETKPFV